MDRSKESELVEGKMAKNNNGKAENFEQTLFKAADKLRKNIGADEYKHIAQGLNEGRGN